MRKIWIVALTCAVLLCGCEEQEDRGKAEPLEFHGMEDFEIVEKSVDGDAVAIRDKKTNVLYLKIDGYRTTIITPLYNADGSLRTYEQK